MFLVVFNVPWQRVPVDPMVDRRADVSVEVKGLVCGYEADQIYRKEEFSTSFSLWMDLSGTPKRCVFQ